MQSSHFENLQPTQPYMSSFQEIKQEQEDFAKMEPIFNNHPFTYAFLDQSDNELAELRKLRKECNQPFQFRPRPRRSFAELDQFEYKKQLTPCAKVTMEALAQKKYQSVKDIHRFPYDFDQEQMKHHQKIKKRNQQEAYIGDPNQALYNVHWSSDKKNEKDSNENQLESTNTAKNLQKLKTN